MNKILVVLIMILAISCEKSEQDINIHGQIFNHADQLMMTEKDRQAMEFAELLFVAHNNKEFRRTLKEEALLKFDGANDILLHDFLKKHSGVKGLTVYDYLNESVKSEKNIKVLFDIYKNQQISIPVNLETWESNNSIPYITFVPEGFSEKREVLLRAIDPYGRKTFLSSKTPPDYPVIVIGGNERVEILHSKPEDELVIPGDEGEGNNIQVPKYRENGDLEKLNRIICTNLSYYESWIFGPPELRLNVISATGTNIHSAVYLIPERNDVDNVWYTMNRSIINWHTATYGDFLIFNWIEEDNSGAISSIEIGGEYGVSASVTIKAEDHHIGYTVVSFTDSDLKVYELGDLFKWKESFN